MLATIISWTQAVPVPNAPAAAGTSTIWPNAIARGDPDRTHIGLPDRQAGQHQHDRSISTRSEEHTSELQSLMRISYAVFCLKKKIKTNKSNITPSCYHQLLLPNDRLQKINITK